MRFVTAPKRLIHETLALVAVGGYFALALHGVAKKSGTSDEFAHVTAGYSYWKLNDYRLQPENGNWAQRIVAVPEVLGNAAFPSLEQGIWRSSNFWLLSDQFFFGGANDPDRLLRRSRMMVALTGALAGLLVFAWSTRLFGRAGGWTSLIMFVFSPTMLAHGALATSDMIAAAFFLAATWSLWIVLHAVSPRTIAVSVLATAGVFLSKYSALIMIPVALSMLAIRVFSSRDLPVGFATRRWSVPRSARRAVLLGGVALLHVILVPALIWASYGFRYTAFAAAVKGGEEFHDPWSEVMDASAVSEAVQWGRAHEVLPEAYLFGMATVAAYSRNRSAFLNGEVSQEGGWRWFFPYAALVKSTIPELLMPLVALAVLVTGRRRHEPGVPPEVDLRDVTPLLLLIGWYWAFSISSTLNIGQRHLMPAMLATMVLLGAAGLPLGRALRPRPSSAQDVAR